MSKTIENLLVKANVAIYNGIENPELAEILAQYGYDANRINEGRELCDETEKLHQKQVMEYGEQYDATREMEEARLKANLVYMKHVKIARVALKNKVGDWDKLQLNGKRKKSFSGWLAEAGLFYTNVLSDKMLVEQMQEYGITGEKLMEGQQLVNDAEAAYAKQRKELGEAQDATIERDEAVDKLQYWYSDYIEIARVALEDKPQYLEIMGIVEPS
ncbi:MAG: hypothetical protein JXJ22_09755 [Bacteroidales bacterium]|nr:hypothetical protein [Bacteroidales bacterium]